MGYDRYGNRYGRERGSMGSGGREGGRGRDDRGWMERAGEEMRSWFRDDDDDGRHRDRDEGRGGYAYGGRDQGGWERSDRDHGYQGGYGRSRDRESQFGSGAYGGQGTYRPMAGDYGRAAGRDEGGYADTYRGSGDDFGHRGQGGYGAMGYGDRNYGGQDAQSSGQGGGRHDPHYQQWRERQMSELDRDYHEYRTENQQRFEEEFHSWRTARQGQRDALRQVREHQEVVGDDGGHVGTVDKVRGDQLILTRNDQSAGGKHHAIPSSWIQGVGEKVMLNRSAEKARGSWREWEGERGQDVGEGRTTRALGDDGRPDDGPHVLERSFSGTYDRDDNR